MSTECAPPRITGCGRGTRATLRVRLPTVQCGWYEGEALEVELDGVSYHLGITMEPLGGGAYHPRVRLG